MQRVSEEEEASEGEGAFSQVLGCLDVKDAFLQVPQEKPLRKEAYLDRGLEQKHGLTFFTGYLTEFSAECPRLGRHEKSAILISFDSCGRLEF